MPGRLSFAAVGEAVSNLPGPAKLIGGAIGMAPILWALFGIGWAGIKTPTKLDAHNAMTDTMRAELKITNAEKAARDSLIWGEQRETNRLLRCSLTNTGDLARARCAAQRDVR